MFAWNQTLQSTYLMTRYLSKNQNTIDDYKYQNVPISSPNGKENHQVPTSLLLGSNFTTQTPVELQINSNDQLNKIDSRSCTNAATITKHGSTLNRFISSKRSVHQTCQDQPHHCLEKSQLFSLTISPNGIKCYGTHYQPSASIESYQCQIVSPADNNESSKPSCSINDQAIKQNISYISLTNLSDMIDHEPNVSRKNSLSKSISNILLHKPSLFLTDILNKMTNEQLVQSIAHLTKLHESRTKSTITLPRTTSLPDMNKNPTKLYSANSLLDDRVETARSVVIDNQNQISITDLDQKRLQPTSIPTNSKSFPKRKLSQENITTIVTNDSSVIISTALSPILYTPTINKSLSKFSKQLSTSTTTPIMSKAERDDSDYSNSKDNKGNQSSFKSIKNSILFKNQQYDEEKNLGHVVHENKNQLHRSIDLENTKQSSSTCNMRKNSNDFLEKNTMNQSLKDFSLCNKITDHPSQSNVLL